mgnify:CR=1 FL=1|jgi:putative chitinase
MLLSEDFIRDVTKRAPADFQQAMIDSMSSTLEKYEIDSRLRMAHFLAQMMHESAEFSLNKENLNYSSNGLLKIFPKYFNASQAEQYARRPIDIASRVYANRMGNGPEDSREGWRYRGRGIIQLTGKDNYERYGNIIGVDLVSDPELACDPVVSLQVACEYWKQRNINEDADNDDIYAITKKINGGTIGINHRIELFNRLYEKLE